MVVQVILITLLLVTLSGIVVLASVWWQLRKYLKRRRLRQLSQMHSYNRRLKIIVSELLSHADDLDQESKYISQGSEQISAKQLLDACNDLVLLSNSLHLIENTIKDGKVKESRDTILSFCRIAIKISADLDSLRLRQQQIAGTKPKPCILPVPNSHLIPKKEEIL